MAVLDGTVRQHVLATMVLQRTRAVLIGVLISLVVSGGAGLAAPQVPVDDSPTGYLNLGGGTYRVTASVFAEGTDGQVGTQASSGHWIQPDDNLVALPACTESSCPWVPTGTGVQGQFGPQTTCAESDGLCWVQIVSATTGECTGATVHSPVVALTICTQQRPSDSAQVVCGPNWPCTPVPVGTHGHED